MPLNDQHQGVLERPPDPPSVRLVYMFAEHLRDTIRTSNILILGHRVRSKFPRKGFKCRFHPDIYALRCYYVYHPRPPLFELHGSTLGRQ